METQIFLQGYFTEYDKFNRAKIMFLDDYDGYDDSSSNGKKYSSLNFKQMSFTKSYLTNLCRKMNGNNPLTDDKQYFYIKCSKKQQIGFINDEMVPLLQLKQHKVEIDMVISKYDFKKSGERFNGWTIKPLKFKLLEM
jgi:hypothetical protein